MVSSRNTSGRQFITTTSTTATINIILTFPFLLESNKFAIWSKFKIKNPNCGKKQFTATYPLMNNAVKTGIHPDFRTGRVYSLRIIIPIQRGTRSRKAIIISIKIQFALSARECGHHAVKQFHALVDSYQFVHHTAKQVRDNANSSPLNIVYSKTDP
jgi:hypothetical protein